MQRAAAVPEVPQGAPGAGWGGGGIYDRRGKAISYWAGQSIFRRLKQKTGISNLYAHRFRYTWAQHALEQGAERQLVQDQMGWTTDQMLRRYSGWVRQPTAADAMPQYAPI